MRKIGLELEERTPDWEESLSAQGISCLSFPL